MEGDELIKKYFMEINNWDLFNNFQLIGKSSQPKGSKGRLLNDERAQRKVEKLKRRVAKSNLSEQCHKSTRQEYCEQMSFESNSRFHNPWETLL